MAITKRFRDQGANITVTAAGEVLFMPGGQVHRWQRQFGNKIQHFAERAAPVNKRPRWGHYGKALKRTIVSNPVRFRQSGPDSFRVYATVGSSAPHAYYVDQGTGIYAGNGPYKAKILPPWTRNSPSLYEHTYRLPQADVDSGGKTFLSWQPVAPVVIKGQKGQRFFDAGLDRAFLFMLRSGARSGAGRAGLIPRISEAFNHLPNGMDSFKGNTPNDAAFRVQLEEWRGWRDAAWKSGKVLGKGYVAERYRREFRNVKETIRRNEKAEIRKAARAKASALRSAKWRKQNADRVRKYNESRRVKDSQKKDTRGAREKIVDSFIEAIRKKYGAQAAGDARNKVRVTNLAGGGLFLSAKGVRIRLPDGSLGSKDFIRKVTG